MRSPRAAGVFTDSRAREQIPTLLGFFDNGKRHLVVAAASGIATFDFLQGLAPMKPARSGSVAPAVCCQFRPEQNRRYVGSSVTRSCLLVA